jgi:hypothetical protein
MCVVSMVHDHFNPFIPGIPLAPVPYDPPQPPSVPWPGFVSLPGGDILQIVSQIAALKELIERFEKAVAAAKVVDALTSQPDCLDPEKAKLVQRVEYWKARAEAEEKALGFYGIYSLG